MTAKLRQMERLARLRRTRERLIEASLAVAMGRLREAEGRLMAAREAAMDGAREALRTMEGGESVEWRASVALRGAFGVDCERFEMEFAKRAEEVRMVQQELHTRRLEAEQAEALARGIREGLTVEEQRRLESAMADRFLGRKRWSAERARVKSLIEEE